MRTPSNRRLRLATTVAVVGCAVPTCGVPSALAATDTPAPSTSRGLVGGLVSGVTTTLDGTLLAVSQATNGAVTLPSTTTITDPLAGTIKVVDGVVDQVLAPAPESGSGPRISLSVPGLINAAGGAAVGLVIGNAGDTACEPLVNLAITGKDGIAVAGGITQLAKLLPGASNTFALPWPAGLNTGNYAVKTSITACGIPQALTVDIKLNAETAADGRSNNPGSNPGSDTGGTGGGSTGGDSGGGTPVKTPVPTGTGAHSDTSSGSHATPVGTGGGNPGTSLNAANAPAATVTPVPVDAGEIADAMGKGAGERRDVGVNTDATPDAVSQLSGAIGPPAPAALLARTGAAAAGLTGKVDGAVSSKPSMLDQGVVGAVVRAAPAVIERAAPALAILGVIAGLFVLQEGLARRDPKLALAPIGPADDLDFDDAHSFLERVASSKTPPAPQA